MKLLLLLTLVVTSMAETQNTPFVNYMLQLQFMTQSYYDSKMQTFRDARRDISGHLIHLNTAGLTEITEGLRAIISIRDEAEAIIEAATGSEECLETSIANWQRDLQNAGSRVALCAEESLTLINNATENLHNFITEQGRLAFEAQNFVLNVFSEVNAITDEQSITPYVFNHVDEIYTTFNVRVVPALLELLAALVNLKETVPVDIHECVSAATARLNDEAIFLRNTLEFC